MVIGCLVCRVSIPESRSLKDKRHVIKSVKERIIARMNMSAAEVGAQDQWQYAELAFVTVAAEKTIVQQRLSELQTTLTLEHRMVLMDVNTHYL
jgi:uncharacterized protein YlxP (DUF503 family)